MRTSLLMIMFFYSTINAFAQPSLKQQRLKVSANHHFLIYEDGTPFLYLGDTAWELFHKLNREEAVYYLKNRAEKGFTIIQAVILAEMGGLSIPNAYGEVPLINLDPQKPNEKYFTHVDFIVNEAQKLGLFVGMLPTWGDKVCGSYGGEPVIFTETTAASYGEFLGMRYKNKPIVWILGGDRDVENETEQKVWRAMAMGIKNGSGGNQLISYHPRGTGSSQQWLNNEPWMDFNMYQSGHGKRYNEVYRYAETLIATTPMKPFVDAEPAYEDIPIRFWDYSEKKTSLKFPSAILDSNKIISKRDYFASGYFNSHDTRVHAYWNFLSGACGYTYGNNAIWQMFKKGGSMMIPCLYDWREALERPGANTMRYIKHIFELRSFSELIPDKTIVVGQNQKDSLHIQSAISANISFALVYLSVGQKVSIDLKRLKHTVIASWYNPKDGTVRKIGEFKNSGVWNFIPPSSGPDNDWLLVLDDKDASDLPMLK